MAAGSPRIKFLGARSQSSLAALYVHALACIVPSLTYETFGIVMLEAFARKTPVVARRLGALPEVVEESGGGITFGSDAELVDAVRLLASSPGVRGELGDRGYAALVRNWSRAPHLARYFEIVAEAHADRGNAALASALRASGGDAGAATPHAENPTGSESRGLTCPTA
jgi:glycosyltransferase involved in cell wall biosynthesis